MTGIQIEKGIGVDKAALNLIYLSSVVANQGSQIKHIVGEALITSLGRALRGYKLGDLTLSDL